jgi:lipoprotein-anchoring transpeptidase ErfK/SrfK
MDRSSKVDRVRVPTLKKLVVRAVLVGVVSGAFVVLWAETTQFADMTVRDVAARASRTEATGQPAGQSGALVAWSKVADLPVSSSPGGRSTQSLSNPNSIGAPLVLLVDATRQSWIRVELPERPNGAVGWVPTNDVSLVRDDERIVVSLSRRHIELLRGSQVVFQATTAVGSPESPTPTGNFYVTEVLKLTVPNGVYGPYALGLSAFSNTYFTFEGGPGQIAIHGTNEPTSVGEPSSHGCIRLADPQIARLAVQVQTGTPVEISQ